MVVELNILIGFFCVWIDFLVRIGWYLVFLSLLGFLNSELFLKFGGNDIFDNLDKFIIM